MAHKNVLLMIADDLGRQVGCFGDPLIQTPHLDRLASLGCKFTRAFASTASCSGSRTTIYTGLHTHQNGMYGLHNGRNHFQTYDTIETAPKLMKDHGYITGIVGKVHVGPSAVYPWDVREESGSRDVAHMADRCDEFLQRAASEKRPFFLTAAFIDPHRDRTRDGFGNKDEFDHRVKVTKYDPKDVPVPSFLNDSPGTRQELATYYESISRMDQGVGMILESLEKRALRDETLIFFMSDNGSPFLNSKTTLYDAGTNLPFIVCCPKLDSDDVAPLAGTTNPNMVSYVDVLPTILDWASHPASTRPDSKSPRLGRSILPILGTTQLLPGWDRVYGSHTFHEVTNYWPTRYIRTGRYKYHRNLAWRLDFPMAADIYGSLAWEDVRNGETRMVGGRTLRDFFFRPPEELYDLEEDPREINNLAKSEEHKIVIDELRLKLEAWQRRTEDPWLYRDGVSVLFVKHHLDAGLQMPDRLDFDPDQPGSIRKGVKILQNVTLGPEVELQ